MKRKNRIAVSAGDKAAPYLFVAPNFVILTIFYGIPLAMGLIYSFTNYDGLMSFSQISFVGLKNYQTVLNQSAFIRAATNTLKYAVSIVPLMTVGALLLAWLTTLIKRAYWLRVLAYVPVTISAIAVGLIWRWVFDTDFGILNSMFYSLGLEAPRWLETKSLAFVVVLIATLWSRVGYFMVLYVSGIENISQQYYEAATIDGASLWQSFTRITIPLLKPTHVMVLILNVIEAFKAYALVYALTRGGPVNGTTMMIQHIYETSFAKMRMAQGNAMAMLLFFAILLLTIIQYALGKGGELE